jgi:hypothetical protein
MKRNHLLLALMAAVLIGATGCPTPNKSDNPTLTDISANYTGTITIYPDTPLDELKDNLTVIVTYSNDTSNILNAVDYTLSGTLTVGNSTIIVTYEDKITAFTVTVSSRIPISPPMQVYNSDRTTPYDGSDLDFYIQGDDGKTVTATIRNGNLVITYNPLPESCVQWDVGTGGGQYSTATDVTSGLQIYVIILQSIDDTKTLRYRQKPSGVTQVAINYFNKDGTFKMGTNEYVVKQGWNFANNGVLTDPMDYAQSFCWVVQ